MSEWALFPGVNVPASFVLIGIFALANGAYYVFITAVMPRSGGGSYVPLSRLVSPILGMGMTTILVVAFLLDMGFIGNITWVSGVSPPLATYAAITNNAGLATLAANIGSQTRAFALGTVMIILVGLIAIGGNRYIRMTNKIAFLVGTLGMVLIVGVLATTSQSQFQTAFNNFAGYLTVPKHYGNTHAAGYNANVNWFNPTFLSLPLSFFAIAGYAFNTYYGGEIRKVSKTMSIAVVGSIFFTGAFFSLIAALSSERVRNRLYHKCLIPRQRRQVAGWTCALRQHFRGNAQFESRHKHDHHPKFHRLGIFADHQLLLYFFTAFSRVVFQTEVFHRFSGQ